jgi:cell division protein FtsB
MKAFKVFIVILVVVVLGIGVFNLIKEKSKLETEVANLSKTVKNLEAENKSLMANIEYFKRPENLLKELKSQFNYKEAGEKMIIIVPGNDVGR